MVTTPLRWGFTTGTAATAAAVGALRWLLGKPCRIVAVRLPQGAWLSVPLGGLESHDCGAAAWVVKDAGDDPDVTHGLAVKATVFLCRDRGIVLSGGDGVGLVTKRGLPVPVGEPAINPAPRAMLLENLSVLLPEGWGIRVILSIPGGKEVAKKTFNPRLGIEGGLSILGTRGVVMPMSEEALQETIRSEISVRVAEGCRRLCFVPGNYGEMVARGRGIPDGATIKIGNFVGRSLDQAESVGAEGILLLGQVGKMLKIAGGSWHTHSAHSDGRRETLAAVAALEGADRRTVQRILEANTADDAARDLLALPLGKRVLEHCARRICDAVRQRYPRIVLIGAVLFLLPDLVVAEAGNWALWENPLDAERVISRAAPRVADFPKEGSVS